ncbi:MAG: ATP-dependent DNA helicase RecG [Eubacterium sp.]|nr:ATP-dependent DNA helicase RecG [Eubacterium sp.]
MELTTPIQGVKGVGAKTEQLFQKMGVYTIGDILLRFPREYTRFPAPVEISEAVAGKKQAVILRVEAPVIVKRTRSMQISIGSGTHQDTKMEFLWFHMPYIRNTLIKGQTFILYGSVQNKSGLLSMEQPVIYTPLQYETVADSLQPVYGLTAGLTNNLYKKTLRRILDQKMLLPEYLPSETRNTYSLAEYNYAVSQIHFPKDFDTLAQARRRLVFDEFFLFILYMQLQKEQGQKIENIYHFREEDLIGPLLEKLPYQLTNAQLRVLDEIQKDLRRPQIMQRLIQGDVGSGKTIVAFFTMYLASANGYQSALMAPTEVLAAQHYETFEQYIRLFGIQTHLVLLTGSMTAKQKRRAYERLQLFSDAMVIGTHALFQERAVYDNLALVITDEQHRFGVRQRETFSLKGESPHILVMSATPIPRTLAIILYGDLDISVIDEVPAKRLPIKNCVVAAGWRPNAYAFIRKEIEAGHQAYVICPLVEASEHAEGENVIDYSEKLKQALPDGVTVAFLHGRMRADLKNNVMEAFAANEVQVLVSTTVVEVGVNVPNATVMMIEDAQRFGLAQLHQLRGRVGRGDAQSYCIMINTSDAKSSVKRLDVLNRTNDGFRIASEDLKLRGPGDFFGIRQSGDLQFQLADIYQDANVLQQAGEEVARILAMDRELALPEHAGLRRKAEEYFERQMERLNL